MVESAGRLKRTREKQKVHILYQKFYVCTYVNIIVANLWYLFNARGELTNSASGDVSHTDRPLHARDLKNVDTHSKATRQLVLFALLWTAADAWYTPQQRKFRPLTTTPLLRAEDGAGSTYRCESSISLPSPTKHRNVHPANTHTHT